VRPGVPCVHQLGYCISGATTLRIRRATGRLCNCVGVARTRRSQQLLLRLAMAMHGVSIELIEPESIRRRCSVTERATLPGRRGSGLDDRSGLGLTLGIEVESAFLLGDEFFEGGEIERASFVGDVVVGDVDSGEGIGELAHVVSGPGESVDDIAKARAAPDSERVVLATAGKDAFFAAIEDGGVFVDGAIGESAELESSGTSAFTEELLESEGALGRLDDIANGFLVDAERGASGAVRASRSEGFDDFLGTLPRRQAFWGLELERRSSHDAGLYHGSRGATAGDDGKVSTGALTQVRGEAVQLFSQAGTRFSWCGLLCSWKRNGVYARREVRHGAARILGDFMKPKMTNKSAECECGSGYMPTIMDQERNRWACLRCRATGKPLVPNENEHAKYLDAEANRQSWLR